MEIEKKINEIADNVAKIVKSLAPDVVAKAQKYDEIISLLKEINIKPSFTKETDLNNGEDFLLVKYSMDPTKITIDDNADLDCDRQFYALNMLNLLGLEFVAEIQKEIEILKMLKK